MYDDATHVPLATLPGMRERTVSISSAGKTFSVTGWKIGWLCAPAPSRPGGEHRQAVPDLYPQRADAGRCRLRAGARDGLGRGRCVARCRPGATGSPPASRRSGSRSAGRKARTSSRPTSAASASRTARRSPARCPTTPAWSGSRPRCSATPRGSARRSSGSRSASGTRCSTRRSPGLTAYRTASYRRRPPPDIPYGGVSHG